MLLESFPALLWFFEESKQLEIGLVFFLEKNFRKKNSIRFSLDLSSFVRLLCEEIIQILDYIFAIDLMRVLDRNSFSFLFSHFRNKLFFNILIELLQSFNFFFSQIQKFDCLRFDFHFHILTSLLFEMVRLKREEDNRNSKFISNRMMGKRVSYTKIILFVKKKS